MRSTRQAILLIATRQIGDVLLATPLLRSLRWAYPAARIDALVYTDKGGMLAGNPDVDAVIEVDEHPDWGAYGRLIGRIARRYDLAVSVQGGDRAIVYALLAARRRVAILPSLRWQEWWKRRVLSGWALLDDLHTHTVLQNLRLAEVLGISGHTGVVAPAGESPPPAGVMPFEWQQTPFAVIHPYPMWRYKRWTRAGWLTVARHLLARDYHLVISGGPAAAERELCAALVRDLASPAACSTAGELTFGQLAEVLRRSRAYVGPDTAVTHLAAACGIPTVALYGPTNPVKWGPWPAAWRTLQNPYCNRGALQRAANVVLVQGEAQCVPCHQEGCERHKGSSSRCLDELDPQRVIAILDEVLAATPRPAPVFEVSPQSRLRS